MSAQLFAKAVRGCKQSAFDLVQGTDDLNSKVVWVLNLCRKKAPRDVVRHVLLTAIAEHPKCIRPDVAGSRALLRELFDYAAYPKPKGRTLTLYRGYAGADSQDARRGYYWTNCRGTAVAYALRFSWALDTYSPLLLTAGVKVGDIAVATDLEVKQYTRNDTEGFYEFIVLKEQHKATAETISVEEAKGMLEAYQEFKAGDMDQNCAPPEAWMENYASTIRGASKV